MRTGALRDPEPCLVFGCSSSSSSRSAVSIGNICTMGAASLVHFSHSHIHTGGQRMCSVRDQPEMMSGLEIDQFPFQDKKRDSLRITIIPNKFIYN